jgi:hypothetical protein
MSPRGHRCRGHWVVWSTVTLPEAPDRALVEHVRDSVLPLVRQER